MQIDFFRVFRDLVDSQSFSKAAQMNGITQSAVSQQIKAVETLFRVPLIERSSKRFDLTREGELFYKTSKDIVDIFDAFQHQLDEMHNVVTGEIRVSTVYSIGLHQLPVYLKAFLLAYPNVNIHVEYRRSNQVYEEVANGISDLGLVAFPAAKKGLRIDIFKKDKLVVVCAPQHPLAHKKEVRISELAAHKFIAFAIDQPTRQAIDHIFSKENVSIRPSMEFDNIETLKQAVEINAGMAIVPESAVEKEQKTGTITILQLHGPAHYRTLGLIYKANRILSPAIKHFLQVFKESSPEKSIAE
ncbi:MAG: LysR family transcriptional regulator [Verrucomicrobiota bacterium]